MFYIMYLLEMVGSIVTIYNKGKVTMISSNAVQFE